MTVGLQKMILLLLFIPHALGQGCGTPRCGFVRPYYQQAVYPPQYPQQPLPARQVAQVPVADPHQYYTNSYVLPPQLSSSVEKELPTSLPEKLKITEYEKFEKELNKLKPVSPIPVDPFIVEPAVNLTGTTYIRELPYPPQPYLPRPLPYRPHPLLPHGCPVQPPQYVRPVPYMPRGYVTPVVQPYPQPPLPKPLPPQPVYPPTYVRPPPLNDCCGRCAHPCHFRQRVQAKASKTIEKDFVPLRETTEVTKGSRCTSEELESLMSKSTTRTPSLSKRVIQKAAEEQFGGFFSVICSKEDFSYIARSELFCQTSKYDIVCYAFQHS